jgi:carbonic anhydrase
MNVAVAIVEASNAEHWNAVRNLFLSYRQQLWQECQLPDNEWQSLPGAYTPPGGGLLLALVDGNPAGCVGLRPFPEEGTREMKRLFLSPEFRGHHLGERLITAVIQLSRDRGYARMRLEAHPPTMATAAALYRRLGFRDIEAAPLRQSAELVYMVLDLKNALADRSTASDFDTSIKLDYEAQTSTTSVADSPVTLVSLR